MNILDLLFDLSINCMVVGLALMSIGLALFIIYFIIILWREY